MPRINPTFGKVDLPNLDVSDPGHVMRESLTDLKENLASGRANLQFDVRYTRSSILDVLHIAGSPAD